jgi:hypothetical protein
MELIMQNEQLSQYIATVLEKAEAEVPVYVEQLLHVKYMECIVALTACTMLLVVVAAVMFYLIKKSNLDSAEKTVVKCFGGFMSALLILLILCGAFDMWKIKTAPSVVVIEHITGR